MKTSDSAVNYPRRIVGLVIAAFSLLTGCPKPYTNSCGTFHLYARSNQPYNFPVPLMDSEVSFSFDPKRCGGSPGTCEHIAYVQMIRFTDQSDEHRGEYFQPSTEQKERMVTNQAELAYNGWAIDRGEGKQWAYYARDDDGSFDSAHTQLGSNTRPAVIRDAIHDERARYHVEIVDVPVCMDVNPDRNGRILGYEGWMFTRANGTNDLGSGQELTLAWMPDAFDLAVAEWNKQSARELTIFLLQFAGSGNPKIPLHLYRTP